MECAHPRSTAAASGRSQADAAKQLLHQLTFGVEAWVDLFAYGFPITGTMSGKLLLPRGKKRGVRLPDGEITHRPRHVSGNELENLARRTPRRCGTKGWNRRMVFGS